jgi:hypothetical protein
MHSTDQEWVGQSGEPGIEKGTNIVGAFKAPALKQARNAVGPAKIRPRDSIVGRRGVARQNPPRLHRLFYAQVNR